MFHTPSPPIRASSRRSRATAPRRARTTAALPVIEPDAAGIDLGATAIYVAVPQDRDPQPVRSFTTFTEDLLACAAWLRQCGVRTIAMEATGVYWIPLFQILEAQGFEVQLVNARHVQNVPGRKSDVSDCQWLQYLHAVGLLRGSFRPAACVCAVRTVLRHREMLVRYAAAHIQHMQKALDQMNLHLHHVLSDLTGKSGMAILDAILAGERDPHELAKLRDRRVKASAETMAKALVGDWRPEHLFTLRQAVAAYRYYHQLLQECDAEIERLLAQVPSCPAPPAVDPSEPGAKTKRRPTPRGNEVQLPHADLHGELVRLWGVDLTQVPGFQVTNAHALFTEIGADLSAFPTAKHFASWLGLCPDNRTTGGKVQRVQTRDVRHRVALLLRLAAQSLHDSKSALGAFYRRMRTRLGAPKAITAAAHKLARILYHLLTTRTAYDESVFAREEERYQRQRLQRLQRDATAMGYALSPLADVS